MKEHFLQGCPDHLFVIFFLSKIQKTVGRTFSPKACCTSSCDPALLCLYVLRLLGNVETDFLLGFFFFFKETGK